MGHHDERLQRQLIDIWLSRKDMIQLDMMFVKWMVQIFLIDQKHGAGQEALAGLYRISFP